MSKFQTVKRVEAAFRKAGANIEPSQYGSDYGYRATKGSRVVGYYTRAGYPDESIKVVTQMFTPSPDTDIRNDYHCDRYHRTIAAAVAELNRA